MLLWSVTQGDKGELYTNGLGFVLEKKGSLINDDGGGGAKKFLKNKKIK